MRQLGGRAETGGNLAAVDAGKSYRAASVAYAEIWGGYGANLWSARPPAMLSSVTDYPGKIIELPLVEALGHTTNGHSFWLWRGSQVARVLGSGPS